MSDSLVPGGTESHLSEVIRQIRERTPARILVGRSGPAYRTSTQLSLRQDHAAALDAVHAEISLQRDFPPEFVERHRLFEVSTCAASKAEYLMRPDLGRRLEEPARAKVAQECPRGVDLQVVVGDGLSAAAVLRQVPSLLPLLEEGARQRGWTLGRVFLIHRCRVGVLNEIGELLAPTVVVLLIGERPGLMTAESLSAYMAYRPRAGHTDAQRNLISNIHARGVLSEVAGHRILTLAAKLRAMNTSGVAVKEDLPGAEPLPPGLT